MGNGGALDVDIDDNLTEVRSDIAVHGFNYRERDARNLNLLRAKYMSNCFHCHARHPVMRMALPLSCKIAETPMQCVSVKTRERRGRARARTFRTREVRNANGKHFLEKDRREAIFHWRGEGRKGTDTLTLCRG